jgi:hypothetical protein
VSRSEASRPLDSVFGQNRLEVVPSSSVHTPLLQESQDEARKPRGATFRGFFSF